jgi:hypothetical protein
MAPNKLPKDLRSILNSPKRFASKKQDREFIIAIDKESRAIEEKLSDPASTKGRTYTISIQKLNSDPSRPTYVAAMLTGFNMNKKGTVTVNFLSVFKYRKIYRHIKKYLDRDEASEMPILDDIENYTKNGIPKSNPKYYEHLESIFRRPELPEQIHFLYSHLKSHYRKTDNDLSNAEFKKYMKSKEARGREFSGLAIELINYIVDKLPKGTLINFELAHVKADQSMIEGYNWTDTNFGKVVLRETGTELLKAELKDYHQTITLIKK